jgi:membrane protein implicated in regulation of membrane protease activity
MLIFLALALLFLLPGPWNLVAFLVLIPIWILELFGWNRTVKHRRRVVGAQTMIGRDAVVVTACRPEGQVRLGGEIWKARCPSGADVGETVRVLAVDGLTLTVAAGADA